MRKLPLCISLFAIVAILTNFASSQTKDEIQAEIPELKTFHTVIFKLWHDAWPNKDIAALSAMLPSIDSGVALVRKAELPGILRDKKDQWGQGINALDMVLVGYKEAVAQKDTQRILDAAEKLHSQFEKLVRITRPALEEIEAFHQTLYAIYHYYLPALDMAKIRGSVQDIQSKMDSLNRATLPERLKDKAKDFTAKRKALDKAVRNFIEVATVGKDEKAVKKSINTMHTRYQALEKIF